MNAELPLPPRYVYAGLSNEIPQIRLLKILPRNDEHKGSGINISLEIFDMQTAPSYVALSYEWGKPNHPLSRRSKVDIHGAKLPVRKNLLAFLIQHESMRFRDPCEYLWIDQISIDQGNIDERNRQVMLMADIYSRAEQVIAWLGWPKSNGRVLKSVETIADVLSSTDPITLSWRRRHGDFESADASLLEHVDTFCNMSYWTRLWIAQELVLGKVCQLMHGGDTLELEHAVLVAQHFRDRQEIRYSPFFKFICLLQSFRGHHCPIKSDTVPIGKDPCDLWFAAAQFSEASHCQELKDKLYGIQSILPTKTRLEVDYRLSTTQVFCRAMTVLLLDAVTSKWKTNPRDVLWFFAKAMKLVNLESESSATYCRFSTRYSQLRSLTETAYEGAEHDSLAKPLEEPQIPLLISAIMVEFTMIQESFWLNEVLKGK